MWSVHSQGLVLAQSLIIECIVLGKGSVAVLFIEQKTPICINVCRGTRQPSRETRPFYLFARFMGIHHLWALQIIIEAGKRPHSPRRPLSPPGTDDASSQPSFVLPWISSSIRQPVDMATIYDESSGKQGGAAIQTSPFFWCTTIRNFYASAVDLVDS